MTSKNNCVLSGAFIFFQAEVSLLSDVPHSYCGPFRSWLRGENGLDGQGVDYRGKEDGQSVESAPFEEKIEF